MTCCFVIFNNLYLLLCIGFAYAGVKSEPLFFHYLFCSGVLNWAFVRNYGNRIVAVLGNFALDNYDYISGNGWFRRIILQLTV